MCEPMECGHPRACVFEVAEDVGPNVGGQDSPHAECSACASKKLVRREAMELACSVLGKVEDPQIILDKIPHCQNPILVAELIRILGLAIRAAFREKYGLKEG